MAEPRLEYVEDSGYIAFNTHDIDIAVALLKRERKHDNFWEECGHLKPFRTWVHRRPALKHEREGYGWTFVVTAGTPGKRGTVPAVEFPEDNTLGPIGRSAEETQ